MKKQYFPFFFGIFLSSLLIIAVARFKRTQIFRQQVVLHPVSEGTIEVEYGEYTLNVTSFDKDIDRISDKEFELLEKDLQTINGTFSVYIKDLKSNKVYKYNEDEVYFAASLYKVPVSIATYMMVETGELDLQKSIIYTSSDYADGSGGIVENGFNKTYTIEELLTRLLKNSDNAAQNMLKRSIPDDIEAKAFREASSTSSNRFFTDQESTVVDVANVFEYLFETAKNEKTGSVISKSSAQSLIETMFETSFDDRITNGLNEDTKFAHKIGNWGETGSWHDCGLIYKEKDSYVVCAMSKESTFEDVVTAYTKIGKFIENQR